MAIQTRHDLSLLPVDELYAVYLAVARADHRMRTDALYGNSQPPPGHYEHRPLPRRDFEERLGLARRMAGGEAGFRGRIARQAAAYEVDIPAVLDHLRAAA